MRRSQLAMALLAAALMVAALSITAEAYPLTYSLGVRKCLQEQTQWCWAASDESILDHFDVYTTQEAIVESVKGSVVNEPATLSEAQQGLSNFHVSTTRLYSYLSFSAIISETYTYHRPVYAHWSWNLGGGHAVVLDGYDDGVTDYVEWMEPLLGDYKMDTYTWFKGGSGSGSDHTWVGTLYQARKV